MILLGVASCVFQSPFSLIVKFDLNKIALILQLHMIYTHIRDIHIYNGCVRQTTNIFIESQGLDKHGGGRSYRKTLTVYTVTVYGLWVNVIHQSQ